MIWWIKSKGTSLFKWFYPEHRIGIRRSKIKERGAHRCARVSARNCRRGMQTLIFGELARISGQRRGYDGVQLDKRDPMVVMACLIASRWREGWRLERHRWWCALGAWGLHRSVAFWIEASGQGDAPEGVEEDRRERGMRGSPISSATSGDGGGNYRLWRQIPRCLIDVFEKEQKGSRKGTWGYLWVALACVGG
jgi:hypothetical protein